MGQYGIKVTISGKFALFTRPELSVERVSYDVITPSAARGILEAVFWHPGMRYIIDRIHILNPIKFTNIRRNEVKSKVLASSVRRAIINSDTLPYISTQEDIVQRSSLVLTDVRYMVEAHFVMTDKAKPEDNSGKFKDMLRRRLERGQCFHQPYLGVREFPAEVELYSEINPPEGYYSDDGTRDFGLMLYDMDYSDQRSITPIFYKAVMNNGIIDVAGSEVFR